MISGHFDVVGAAGPTRFFSQLTPDALAHGYLFSGPPGVGKKTFALRLAQSLLCQTPKSSLLGYCGTCSSCVRVESGTHPDLAVAEGQVKIGERDGGGPLSGEEATARDLVRHLSLHSYAGGRRVFILGDVDFTREAANALLKFFEEPPAGVFLILTTAAVARLLPTIRSRMVEVPFPLLTAGEVATILERRGIDPATAARVAPLAGGSATRAQALVGGEESVRDAVVTWFFAAVAGAAADSTGWATRETLEDGLDVVRSLTRDWLALQLAGGEAPLLAPDQAGRLAGLPAPDPVKVVRALGLLGDAERMARTSNVTPSLVADLAKMAVTAIRAGS